MRTTVDIPEELLRIAKQRALTRGETLSQLVQQALRQHLNQIEVDDEGDFELLVAGSPGGPSPSPVEIHQLLDEDDWRRPK